MVPNLIKIRVWHIRRDGNTLGQVTRWTVPVSLGAMMSYYVDHVFLFGFQTSSRPRWYFRKRWAWAQAQLLRLGYHPGLCLAEDGICYPMSLPTLLGTFGLGFDPKVHFELRTSHCGFIDWTSTGSTAENPSLHKSRHRICSVGSPKQRWWRLTSTIDRNWSLTRDFAVLESSP